MNRQLSEIIREEADSPIFGKIELTPETDICIDLEISDRAMLRLMNKFSEIFNVDISSFDIDYYYPSRKLRFGTFLFETLKAPFSERARNKVMPRSLTVGELEQAIEKGRWRGPDSRRRSAQ